MSDNHQHTPIDVYSERFIDPIMVRCSECGETLIGPTASLFEPEITAEFNNCPTHGAVDKDHRCPAFDGVLRDGFTGEIVPDAE
jgi:hypothetical protein